MTPQELKNSILQLAIQGKLVAQRPEEGTAEELYQQIQAEKQKLIKEGKIKKEKPLPEITEEEKPFDIPDSWRWVRLIEFCTEIFSGKSPVYSKAETEYRIIGQAANQNKGIDYSQIKYTNHDFWSSMEEKYFLRENDVLLNTLGNGTLGRSGIVTHLVYPLLTDGHLFVFRCIDKVISKYLYYYLQLKRSEIEKKSFGSTNQTFLNLRNTINWIIPIPPLSEQNRIVAKIEELLPLIDRYEKAWNQLEELNKQFPDDMQKSILQMAIQGKLVEQRLEEGTAEELYQQIQSEKQKLIKEGKIKKEKPLPEITEEEKPFDIPESWRWARLESLSEIIGDGIHGTPEYDTNGNYYFINGNNLSNGNIVYKDDTQKISETEYQKHKKPLRETTVLLSINGTIGNIAYYNNEPVILGKSACYITLLHGLYRPYLSILLKSKFFIDFALQEATQTTIKNVSLKAIRMFPIPLPSLAEQKRIVAKVEELFPLCQRLSTANK